MSLCLRFWPTKTAAKITKIIQVAFLGIKNECRQQIVYNKF